MATDRNLAQIGRPASRSVGCSETAAELLSRAFASDNRSAVERMRDGLKKYGWLPGGLLYGLSFPSHPFPWLGFLALVALVPTLICLIEEESFGRFFAKTAVSFFIGCSVAIWWVYPTHYLASFLGGVALALCLSVPCLLFFPLRKLAGTGFALLLLPFVWTAWEWVFSFLPFCIPLLFFGHTQSVRPDLIQYASVTGVWGVSFWLVACNALAVAALRGWSVESGNRILKVLALLLTLPTAYSLFIHYHDDAPASRAGINILLIQPNRISHAAGGSDPGDLGVLVDLTAKGLATKPDLIIWPEAAAQHPRLQLDGMREFLSNEVKDWDVPLLTGTLALERIADGAPPDLSQGRKRRHDANKSNAYYNAATIVTPELASYIGQHKRIDSRMYYKRKLFPFVEFTPYADSLPFLTRLQLPLTVYQYQFARGDRPETFLFKSRAGDKLRMGALICFEEFYPNLAAELAENGAQFITIIADEWQFHPETSHYFNMMVSGVRAIETGLPVVRNANNGYLAVTDARGVTTRLRAAQASNAVIAIVHPLRVINTFYVLHKNWFPVFCILVAGILSIVALVGAKASKYRLLMPTRN